MDELPSAGKHPRGSGSQPGYVIEVRTSYYEPSVIGDFVIDSKWRRWPVRNGAMPFATNIPIKPWYADMLDRCGLLPYVAAEAHRWALLAFLEASQVAGSLCIETRLVEVMYKYSFSGEEVGVSAALSADDWRFSRRTPFSSRRAPQPERVSRGDTSNTDPSPQTTPPAQSAEP